MPDPVWHSDLGGLADPALFTEPLDIAGHETPGLLALLRSMLRSDQSSPGAAMIFRYTRRLPSGDGAG